MTTNILARSQRHSELVTSIHKGLLTARTGVPQHKSLEEHFWCIVGARESYVTRIVTGQRSGSSSSMSGSVRTRSAGALRKSATSAVCRMYCFSYHFLVIRIVVAAVILYCTTVSVSNAGSVNLQQSEPEQFDFLDVTAVPPDFGRGEFTFELWIKPDNSFPVGPTYRGSATRRVNWTEADIEPYSRTGWWWEGNWLLDGHTRPDGFGPGSNRIGTFSLQFYGGGRLRWMFSDGTPSNMPKGSVWAIQAYPAKSTKSLLDGAWHHVACVRRWKDGGAQLELWIDGSLINSQVSPRQMDMSQIWSDLAHPDDPDKLGGWAIGSEVMLAWNFFFREYEDYKGLVDEIRFWNLAKSPDELSNDWPKSVDGTQAGLVGWFDFEEDSAKTYRDKLSSENEIVYYRTNSNSWSSESAPVK